MTPVRTDDPIKVMVVDDSSVIRQCVVRFVSGFEDMEVVGTACNGQEALNSLATFNPDVVILDVEMPVLDGLSTLAELRKRDKKLPVIMFSTLTERGASTTIDALTKGANDYVPKPTSLSKKGEGAPDVVWAELESKIRLHSKKCNKLAPAIKLPVTPSKPRPNIVANHKVSIVGIAISTGGPNAMAELFKGLPEPLSVPILITQHMPPIFTKMFADRLNSFTKAEVCEAQTGDEISPGRIYVAPGDFHLEVISQGGKNIIQLSKKPHENSCRPAADVMFRSMVSVYGAGILGVVMTGMGSDGLKGLQLVQEKGGQVIAQDEASCAVWGMPGAVVHAGLASEVVSLTDLAGVIKRRINVK
jgi:two-component system, chemotaxis family, protein-glutamate methylesterase/glutaminase